MKKTKEKLIWKFLACWGIAFFLLMVLWLSSGMAVIILSGLKADTPTWWNYGGMSIVIFGLLWVITGLIARIIEDKNIKTK